MGTNGRKDSTRDGPTITGDCSTVESEQAIENAISGERWDEARRQIEAALAVMPDGWAPLTETATYIEGTFWDLEEFRAYSRRYFNHRSKSISRRGPSYSKLWWQLAVINRQEKKYQEAIDCVDRGLQLEPDHPYLWAQRGLTLCAMVRYEEALFAYQTAESARPWSPDAVRAWILRSQGYPLIELGRISKAKSVCALSLEFDPDSENTNNELDYIEHLFDDQELKQRKMPIPADLFRAWQEGGKEKLGQMLENMLEEEDEE